MEEGLGEMVRSKKDRPRFCLQQPAGDSREFFRQPFPQTIRTGPACQQHLPQVRGAAGICTGNGMGNHGTAVPKHGPDILSGQQIIGSARDRITAGQFADGRFPGRRKGHAPALIPQEQVRPGRIPFTFIQSPGRPQDLFRTAAFGTEAQIRDRSQAVQQSHGAPGEIFRSAAGVIQGQFQDKVGPVLQQGPGPDLFGQDGRFAALDIITAHDGDQPVAACDRPGLFQKISVSLMKGIAFHNDAGNFHDHLHDLLSSYQSIAQFPDPFTGQQNGPGDRGSCVTYICQKCQ